MDISDEALSLARENILFQNVEERVRAIKSDLFAGVKGEVYDLIVSNPPYVTEQEFAALPAEYSHEPALGLIAGDDGLDFALHILDDAPKHLNADGWLIVEVGESERALQELLPRLPLNWIEFDVGQMGVFAIARSDLVEHAKSIKAAVGEAEVTRLHLRSLSAPPSPRSPSSASPSSAMLADSSKDAGFPPSRE